MNSWVRNGATLDMDFTNDRYFLNGTSYSGVNNFIAGSGATFSRPGQTITSSSSPFYLGSSQSWVSRAPTNTTYTSILSPFYLSATQSWVSRAVTSQNYTSILPPFYLAGSQTWVSRADTGTPATYFDSSGTLQTASQGAVRSGSYYYSGSSWVGPGTLIEPAATNYIRNNTMAGAVASTAITAQTITNMTDSAGTATVTTGSAHGLAVGNIVTVSGASPSNYNGTFYVASVPNSTTFTYVMASDPGANYSTLGSYTAQTTGTIPNNWGLFAYNNSAIIYVVGTGTESGINYIDIAFSGTVAPNPLTFESTSSIAASQGQNWTESFYARIMSGSLTNVTLQNGPLTLNSSGTGLNAAYLSTITPTTAALNTQRFTNSFTISDGPTAYILPRLRFAMSGSYSFTLRIGMPQMERNLSSPFASSVIATSSGAVTRAADVYTNAFDGTYIDSGGNLQTTTSSVARTDYAGIGSTASGTLIEPAATNGIRNNTMQGAIASVSIPAQTISGIANSSGTATVTTSLAHNLSAGNIVTISGVTVSGTSSTIYNGTFSVVSVPTTTTFTYTMISDPGATVAVPGSYTAQTQGTGPTNWTNSIGGGMTRTIVGSGTSNGISYIDINVKGVTTNNLLAYNISSEGGTAIAAANGQVWTNSVYLALVAGTIPNRMALQFNELNSTITASVYDGIALPALTSTLTRYNYTAITKFGATMAYIQPQIWVYSNDSGSGSVTNQSVNFTLRIGMPQMEQSGAVTSVIPTYGAAAVTRNADVYTNAFDGTYIGSTGVMNTATTSVARYDYAGIGTTASGTLIEPAATNGIRNSTMQGAIASVAITPQTISSITDSSGTATVTTAAAHNLGAGYIVTVSGASPSNYNGTFPVVSVPSTTSFTYTMATDPGANATTVGSYTAQTQGTLPTNWSLQRLVAGVNLIVNATGVESNIPYIDLKMIGMPTNSSSDAIFFDNNTAIAGSNGQTWTPSAYVKLSGGSASNVTSNLGYEFVNGSGSYLAGTTGTVFTPTSSALSTQRIAGTGTVNNSSTAYVYPVIAFAMTIGSAVNETLRIGLPQMELSSYTTSAIPTYGVTVTRNADVYMNPNGGTYYDLNGVLQTAAPNVPRLDHNPFGNFWPKGILIEESRTNLISTSSGTAGENAGGTAASTYVTSSVTSPDGSSKMLKCVESPSGSGSGGQTCRWLISMSASTAYTASMYLKAGERTAATLLAYDGSTSSSASVDLSGGTSVVCGTGLTSTSTSIQQIGTSGIYRVTLSFTTTSGATSGSYFDIRMSNVTPPSTCNGSSYTGDGASGLYVWGVQLEQGGFPTSYIPTSGATATRSADTFTLPTTAAGSNGAWYTAGVGTLGAVGVIPYVDTTNAHRFAEINDGTINNIITLSASTGAAKTAIINSGTVYGDTFGSVTANTPEKIIFTYNSSGFNAAVNGGAFGFGATAQSSIIPTVTTLDVGAGANGGPTYFLDGWVNRIWYMPTRQPDASLTDYTR